MTCVSRRTYMDIKTDQPSPRLPDTPTGSDESREYWAYCAQSSKKDPHGEVNNIDPSVGRYPTD